VSLSWGGPGTFPHRYEAGKRQLEAAFGVEVVEMPHTLADAATLAADPAARADDLHRAFADPDIAGVVSTIGGDDSIRLLRHLDLELLAANPKVFLGYSDSTILQMALLRAGLTSFYGPAIMAGFGRTRACTTTCSRGSDAPCSNRSTARVAREPRRVDRRTPRLVGPRHQQHRRELQPSTGWRWHGGAAREGTTVVGCLEVLDFLRGTGLVAVARRAVLLLETSEDQPPPVSVTYLLRSLAATGELHRLAGIVFGRPGGADLPVDEHLAYDDAILRVVRDEEGLDDLPVVTNVDFGHTDPIWTVPQGAGELRIDPRPNPSTLTWCPRSPGARSHLTGSRRRSPG
jgi:muramoyltetrapeptide carboxypeptidase LdcA involved in peptidoglycan recycling